MQSIFFAIVLLSVLSICINKYGRIRRNIFLGKENEITGSENQRWKNVLLVAFGQKKMFKRPIPAILHGFIYIAFLLSGIELIEIIIDGLTGHHRFFADSLGWLYTLIINMVEILSLLAFIGTVVFLARRNLLKMPRFTMAEMKGWPFLDANIILFGEIFLIVGIFTMNGADTILQTIDPAHYPDSGKLLISGIMGPAILGSAPESLLVFLERTGWWMHILAVFGFLVYLPYSKHLHIMFAFPNTFYASLKPRGEMTNMPEIMNEVKSMMGLSDEEVDMDADLPSFGAKDIFDLPWTTILGAYTCTECGRCSSVCPANQTGKKLSPRKIMMDIRDRADEVGCNLDTGAVVFMNSDAKRRGESLNKSNYDDGKSLFDYVTKEEIHACTTCNACVEACPVLINPLEPILEMRRYEILTLSEGPSDWIPMFNALENTGSVWQMADARDKWATEINENKNG